MIFSFLVFFFLYFSFETEDWNCNQLFHRNFSQRGTFFSYSEHKAGLSNFFLILNFCAHQLNDPNIMTHCLTQFLEFDPIMAVNRKLDSLRKSAFDKRRKQRHNQVHWLSRPLTIGSFGWNKRRELTSNSTSLTPLSHAFKCFVRARRVAVIESDVIFDF